MSVKWHNYPTGKGWWVSRSVAGTEVVRVMDMAHKGLRIRGINSRSDYAIANGGRWFGPFPWAHQAEDNLAEPDPVNQCQHSDKAMKTL